MKLPSHNRREFLLKDRALDRLLECAPGTARRTHGDAWPPRPIPVIDGLLAATGKVHRPTLATGNVADVCNRGARVLDPFSAAAKRR